MDIDEGDNPMVYLVPADEIEDFCDGYMSAAFGGKPLRLKYAQYWQDLTNHLFPKSTDTDVYSNERVSDPQDEADLEELLIEAQFGNALAVIDALILCQRRKIHMPDILVEEIKSCIRAAILGEKLGGRGRGNSPKARAQKYANKRRRIDIVDRIVSCQTGFGGLLNSAYEESFAWKFLLPAETINAMRKGLVTGLGKSKEDVFLIAEISLRGTEAQCSLETLKSEYYSGYGEPEYEPDPETAALVGIAETSIPLALSEDLGETLCDFRKELELVWRTTRAVPDAK